MERFARDSDDDGDESATGIHIKNDEKMAMAQQFLQNIPLSTKYSGDAILRPKIIQEDVIMDSDAKKEEPICIPVLTHNNTQSVVAPVGDMNRDNIHKSKNDDALRFLQSISITAPHLERLLAPADALVKRSSSPDAIDIVNSDEHAFNNMSQNPQEDSVSNLTVLKRHDLQTSRRSVQSRTPIWLVSRRDYKPVGIYSLSVLETKIRSKKKGRTTELQANMESRIMAGLESLRKKKAESYGHLLHPSSFREADGAVDAYDPFVLDDPELRAGKHRTIISLPSYLGSIVHYSRPRDLKNEINLLFRKKYPDLDPSLTLSQIRSVKRRLFDAALELNIELSSVAKAYAYFEKLVLKNNVYKENRRLVGGICLFLACKVNDNKQTDFATIAECLGRHLSIHAKEIREQEFSIFAALEFNLQIPSEEYSPHFERIFNFSDFSNIQEYLGEIMYKEWQSSL